MNGVMNLVGVDATKEQFVSLEMQGLPSHHNIMFGEHK
jgi:hypothetical protein